MLAACVCLTFAGCQFEKDIDLETYGGRGLEFVHFNTASDSWTVTKDDASYVYEVPVACSYKYDTDKTYEIKLGEETTGVEGVDFKIANKSVTIPAGKYTATVPVEVLYDTTGEGFVLELVLGVAEELINDSYGASQIVNVKSDKITIDWEWLAGDWTANDWSYYNNKADGDPYTVGIVKVDETNLLIRNLWGMGAEFNATVDFDALTITIPGFQEMFYYAGYSATFTFIAVDPENDFDYYDDITTPVVATMAPAGIVIDNWDLVLVGGPYNGYTYGGGYRTTLTR